MAWLAWKADFNFWLVGARSSLKDFTLERLAQLREKLASGCIMIICSTFAYTLLVLWWSRFQSYSDLSLLPSLPLVLS